MSIEASIRARLALFFAPKRFAEGWERLETLTPSRFAAEVGDYGTAVIRVTDGITEKSVRLAPGGLGPRTKLMAAHQMGFLPRPERWMPQSPNTPASFQIDVDERTERGRVSFPG